jgi:hypothetical protein
MSSVAISNKRLSNNFITTYRVSIPYFKAVTTSSYWVCPTGVTSITAVLVAGGGAGGQQYQNIIPPYNIVTYAPGGGGGAGGVSAITLNTTPGSSYLVVIGAGGSPFAVPDGSNTYIQVSTQNVRGGGAGGTQSSPYTDLDGRPGGSGGGAGAFADFLSGGAGTSGQGFGGGGAYTNFTTVGGGGGGGGGGASGTSVLSGAPSTGGNGGSGRSFNFLELSQNFYGPTYTSSSFVIGGGGGGGGCASDGTSAVRGQGGAGGGGAGGQSSFISSIVYTIPASSGGQNTGGGGGGGATTSSVGSVYGGYGGSGVVYIYGQIASAFNIAPSGDNNLTDSKILFLYTPSSSTEPFKILNFNYIKEYYFTSVNTSRLSSTAVTGWNAGYILATPYNQDFGTLYFDITGAPAGIGTGNTNGAGGNPGNTISISGSYINNLRGALYLSPGQGAYFQDNGWGFHSGGRGGNGSSGGGAGGGGAASTVVLNSNGNMLAFIPGAAGGGGVSRQGFTWTPGLSGESVKVAPYFLGNNGGPGAAYRYELNELRADRNGGNTRDAVNGGGGGGGGGGNGIGGIGSGGSFYEAAAGGTIGSGSNEFGTYAMYMSGATVTTQDSRTFGIQGLIRIYVP